MDILYRRFVLFTAFVAVLGVFAANLIIETKRTKIVNSSNPVSQMTCQDLELCMQTKSQAKFIIAAISQV